MSQFHADSLKGNQPFSSGNLVGSVEERQAKEQLVMGSWKGHVHVYDWVYKLPADGNDDS